MNPVSSNFSSSFTDANSALKREIENPQWFSRGKPGREAATDLCIAGDVNAFVVTQDQPDEYIISYFELGKIIPSFHKFFVRNGMIELEGKKFYPSFQHFRDGQGLDVLHGFRSDESNAPKNFSVIKKDDLKSPRKAYAAIPLPSVMRSPTPTDLKFKDISFKKPRGRS